MIMQSLRAVFLVLFRTLFYSVLRTERASPTTGIRVVWCCTPYGDSGSTGITENINGKFTWTRWKRWYRNSYMRWLDPLYGINRVQMHRAAPLGSNNLSQKRLTAHDSEIFSHLKFRSKLGRFWITWSTAHLTFNSTPSAPYGVVNRRTAVMVCIHLHVDKEKVAYAPPFDPLPSHSLDHVSPSNLSYIQRFA